MKTSIFTFALAALASASAFGQTPTKIAIVDFQKAVLGTAEIKKAQAELEAKFRPRQEAMQKIEKELQQIQTQLQTMAGKLTPQAENDLRVQGTRKEREYQRQGEDLQQDVDRERNDIIQKSGRQMREIINKLAVDKGMDVIVDSANTLYFKNALELTADAIAAYDAAYPTK